MTTILNEVIALARALWKTAKQSENPIEKRLTNIKSVLSKIASSQSANNNGSWIAIASKTLRAEAAPIAERPAVRVRMPDISEKTNSEILTAVRTVIKRAYAVKPMRSGDIEVIVPD